MSRISQNASRRIGATIANYLSVPLRTTLSVVLRETIARASGNVVQWTWCRLGRTAEDRATLDRTRQAVVDRPYHFIRRYPSLVWAVICAALPSAEAAQPGAGREAILGQVILKRLVPEFKVARIVEQLDDPMMTRFRKATLKTAEGRLCRFAKSLGISTESLSSSSVYDKVPLPYIDVDFLLHIVWLIGTVQPTALLELLLLKPTDKAREVFLRYPNLAMINFLLVDNHLDISLRRVVRHLIGSDWNGPAFDNDDELRLSRTMEGFEAEAYTMTAVFFKEFWSYASADVRATGCVAMTAENCPVIPYEDLITEVLEAQQLLAAFVLFCPDL